MKKTAKRFLSMLLVLSMVFGLLVFPAAATETEEPAEVVETAAETTPAVEEADVRVEDAFHASVLLGDGEVVIDEEDPAIIAMEDSLQNVKVLGADGASVKLTEAEKEILLGLYQKYLKQWSDNAHLLGVQTPFFLSYNDGDELGVLGEMLVLANIPLEEVRAGKRSFDELKGMLETFLYADELGIKYYASQIVAARDEVMALIDKSGAQTEAQKLLVLNDWLAHNVTFDMPYIMNADKDTNKDGVVDEKDDNRDPMVAENPQDHEHKDEVYKRIYPDSEKYMGEMFRGMIIGGLQENIKIGYYQGAIQDVYYKMTLEKLITEEAQKEGTTYFVDSKVAFVNDWYEENKEGEAYQKAYNEAYNAYLDENCEKHDFDVVFTISDEPDEEGKYTATADLTCKKCGREHKNKEANVTVTTEAADCKHGNQTIKTATVTVDGFTYSKEEKSDDGQTTDHVDVAEPVDSKCDVCGADMPTTEGGEDAQTVDAEVQDEEAAQTADAAVQDEQIAEAVAADAALQKAAAEHAEDAAKAALQDAANNAYDALSSEQRLELAKKQVRANETVMATMQTNAKTATEKYMADNAAAINKDPIAFVNSDEFFKTKVPVTDGDGNVVLDENKNPVMMTLAEQIHAGWDPFWKDCVDNGIPGMVAQMKLTAYQEAIKDAVAQGAVEKGMSEEEANAYAESYLKENEAAIAADPYAFCVENFGKENADLFEAGINDQLTQMGIDVSTETNPDGRVDLDLIVKLQMDTPMDDLGGMTPNEAIPVFAKEAATKMTKGVLDYWQGSQFGALGRGSAVCLGYTKAFTYLVQYMHPEIYGTDGADTDMSNPEKWKSRDDLYVYDENGNIDITQNYVVDAVRVTFDAEVTMFGNPEENFNSDHFWNAVKVDGQWYYIDPCYTDVFTLVMARDRVETDGYMNHLYFLFSHGAAMQLYDGNYKVIKTLYYDEATGEDYTSDAYEDSWFSRIKSNTYFADGYAYYLYDSTDMLTLLEEFEEEQQEIDFTAIQKIVRHKLDSDDFGNGDEDYEPLIVLNYEDDDGVYHSRVWDPSAGAAKDNEMLTELYDRHSVYASIYPSINVTVGLYNGKIYFNVANCIVSYDISTSEVAVVKEYNTVHGVRDDTNAFGGMAFTVTTAENADFTVENHPIAALTIKEDGNMYVSIATNFGFISGKAVRTDPASDGYGYAYEESNYNPNYSSYMDTEDSGYTEEELEEFGYKEELNDNDEFMWTANFVETLDLAHFAGSEHKYEEVSVDAFCGVNAYTENRCTTCGHIEAGSRVEVEESAHDHHYIKFDEEYYTKDEGDDWNKGTSYVCTMCGKSVMKPTEPKKSDMMSDEEYEEQVAQYEIDKAEYDAAVEGAGHDYVPTDAEWSEDNTQVTFSALECGNVCPTRKPYLDVLLNDATLTATPKEKITADAEFVGYYGDDYAVYQAAGEAECDVNGETRTVAYTASKLIELEDSKVTRVSGSSRYETALEAAEMLKEIQKVETFDNIVVASGVSFPDALSGSYLATELNAPILLVKEKNNDDVLTYIEENLSADGVVYILGGTASVPGSFVTALGDAEIKCERLSGTNRYLTNLEILGEAGLNGKKILVCTGDNFADSLAASATNLPILLVNGKDSQLSAHQTEFLERVENCTFYIIGGPNTVSAEIETELQNYGEVKRVSGMTREETSVKVAEEFFEDPDTVALAYSRNFPDGLSGGPVAYALGAPLLLVNAGAESYAVEYVESNEIETGVVLGGANSISDETIRTIFAMPIHDKIMER